MEENKADYIECYRWVWNIDWYRQKNNVDGAKLGFITDKWEKKKTADYITFYLPSFPYLYHIDT